MRLRLASRKSDLARIQAYAVGEAIKKAHPNLEIEYLFRESLGDKNLSDPLWQMPEKGVFTQDFHEDLLSQKADLVVHSWKDLPTEISAGTEIAATMLRADMRDVFLFRKDRLESVKKTKMLRVFSSSPRRAYNLENFFKLAFPGELEVVKFETIRGNVPTRISKLFSSESQNGADGLIVAKAALDRLLSATQKEFRESQIQIRAALDQCLFMVLPLQQNPAAAAQGALAIEVASSREDIKKILRSINHQESYEAILKERKILSDLGGGCHQKIGVSCLSRNYGTLTIVRAFTDAGVKIDNVGFESRLPKFEKTSKANLFPLEPSEQSWFDRESVETISIPEDTALWIAKAQALPEGKKLSPETRVWVSGWETWKKLARRGVWVTGSSESLGEEEDPALDILLNHAPKWTKLTHVDADVGKGMTTVGTYKLIPKKSVPNLGGKTHFYWMSGTSFERALSEFPSIKNCFHACGPGNTYLKLREILGEVGKIQIFPSHSLWLKEVGD